MAKYGTRASSNPTNGGVFNVTLAAADSTTVEEGEEERKE